MNKAPSVSQSQNLPAWEFRRERTPVQKNPGPALIVSANSVDEMPCLEDGKDTVIFQTGCVQNTPSGLTPLGASQPVIQQNETVVLEDGRETQVIKGQCLESHASGLAPSSATQDVIRQDTGTVLENVKMNKGLT